MEIEVERFLKMRLALILSGLSTGLYMYIEESSVFYDLVLNFFIYSILYLFFILAYNSDQMMRGRGKDLNAWSKHFNSLTLEDKMWFSILEKPGNKKALVKKMQKMIATDNHFKEPARERSYKKITEILPLIYKKADDIDYILSSIRTEIRKINEVNTEH